MRMMLAGSLKTIGQDMAVDPKFAPDTIVRLKMQGVEQLGDFAIQIHMTMMTRPGEQFVIRRKADAHIKLGLNANLIRFALPAVRVTTGDTALAAIAHEGCNSSSPPPARRSGP
jgi:small-conductance mechanosensitive channel